MTVLNLSEWVLSWESTSPEDTREMGRALGDLLLPGDVVALFGDLGSGKTVLVQGIAAGLGCPVGEVHSPSFTLINEYPCRGEQGDPARRRQPLWLAHVDLYRLRSEDEMPGIGWDDYLNSRHVVAVEWAERAVRWLPRDHLRVTLAALETDRRRISVEPTGSRSARVARSWVEGLRTLARMV